MKILTDLDQLQLDRIEAKLDKLLAPKKRKPRTSKALIYPLWFDAVWHEYPQRSGSNPKQRAFNAALKRIDDCYSDEIKTINKVMYAGVKRYAAYCEATDKLNTEYVMQAATFFGPDKHYENDWTIPKQPKDPAEINSPIHDAVDFEQLKAAEKRLDPVDPYADMKEQNDE